MNNLSKYSLKAANRIYSKIKITSPKPKLNYIENPEIVSNVIYDLIMQDKPCMIARFGSTELNTLVNYLGIKQNKKNIFTYIRGKSLPWWWNDSGLEQMEKWSGFFPPTYENIERFCEMMIDNMASVDILGSWQDSELYFENNLINATKIKLLFLDPYWSQNPWTRALENKKVLVVHPFASTILSQYENREKLFKVTNILPKFKKLYIIKAIQSLSDNPKYNDFNDWFEALEYMKNEINKYDFDICLIGCGAYGFPLAAHVKSLGKKSVHVGGSLQLLFGIRGNRWDQKTQYFENDTLIDYAGLVNEFWVRPLDNERPETHINIESSCYW